MTNDEARRNDEVIGVIRSTGTALHRRFQLANSFGTQVKNLRHVYALTIQRLNDLTRRSHSSFRAEGAVTIIELLLVIIIILILAGLILSISSYVQNKGKRARAETEIAAMSAALESYKADNGIYPRDTNPPGNGYTDSLNARSLPSPVPSPSPNAYTNASVFLYTELSGLGTNQQPIANKKAYFTFRPQMLGHPKNDNVTVAYLRDPFGNCYGYSTAYQANANNGFNPTFDLWSTANDKTGNTSAWIKNW